MKDKLVKSYIFLGNLPIYNSEKNIHSNGVVSPNGCDFVINTRIKYEMGLCSLQFIKQTHPSTYNIETSKFSSEIELDMSSIIRLKRLIIESNSGEFYPTYREKSFIHITSTKLLKSVEFQKGAFVRAVNSNDGFTSLEIIMDTKQQESFKIIGKYQVMCFHDLLDLILNNLPSAYINYDINKNHTRKSTTIFGNEQPKPTHMQISKDIIVPSSGNVPPPVPVTKQVIPQPPSFK